MADKVEKENRSLTDAVEKGEGVWGFYDGVAKGAGPETVEPWAIVDDVYALAYAKNLDRHLRALCTPLRGNVLDVGSALGTLTNALDRVKTGDGATHGLDISQSAVEAAVARYPQCRFTASLADDLSAFDDGYFSTIHAREFYPFTRSADAEYHAHFLTAFLPKLAPGGVVAAVQIVEPEGLADTYPELRRRYRELGYASVRRRVVVPYRAYRRLGDLAYFPGVYGAIALMGRGLEFLRLGQVSYLYFFQKGAR